MGVPSSEVGYTIATSRKETTKVHKNMWWQWKKKEIYIYMTSIRIYIHYIYINFLFSNPCTDLDRRRGFQGVEAPRFQDNRHMKVVRLSALRTGRLYLHEICSFLLQAESKDYVNYIMTPSGIEPATFRLVAQCLNQLICNRGKY